VSFTVSNLTLGCRRGGRRRLLALVWLALSGPRGARCQPGYRVCDIAQSLPEGRPPTCGASSAPSGLSRPSSSLLLLLSRPTGQGCAGPQHFLPRAGRLFSRPDRVPWACRLAVRCQRRVAAAARAVFDVNGPAMRIAFSTGGVGHVHCGLVLVRRPANRGAVSYKENAPNVPLAGLRIWRRPLAMFMRVGGCILPGRGPVGGDLGLHGREGHSRGRSAQRRDHRGRLATTWWSRGMAARTCSIPLRGHVWSPSLIAGSGGFWHDGPGVP